MSIQHTGERTVSRDRILQVSKGGLRPLFARPDFSTASVPWAGFLIEECINDVEEKSPSSLPKPMVVVSTRDQCTTYWRYRGASNNYNVRHGLWMLTLGGGRTSSSDTLYFTAGPNGETHGLFGTITPIPD